MSETLSSTEISELICTRISHDLIGNIGAVSNAVELLEEGDTDFMDDIRSILNTSSTVLSARLKFFRMAFGLNNSNLEKADMIFSVSQDYLKTLGNANYPLELKMKLSSAKFGRMAMLCLMIVADTMFRGGRIEVEEDGDALAVVGFSEKAASPEKVQAIKEALSGNVPDNPAQFAPVFYLQELLGDTKYKLYMVEQNSFGFIIK
ncbi:MAG: hypothetical protein J6A33_05305 [Alphaproteobacteria bacterium]|nr:hypothetical protein [Alphaproteobacteria bacterium]